MEIIGFTSLWPYLCYVVRHLKIYRVYNLIYVQEFSQWLSAMQVGSDGKVMHIEANVPPKLHRVFSQLLDSRKSWFALNSVLCRSKPSRFCSLDSTRVFPNEYSQVDLNSLFKTSGDPVSTSWFSASGRRNEKVYVCTAFGLLAGILRQRSLDVAFVRSTEFQPQMAWINVFDPVQVGKENDI